MRRFCCFLHVAKYQIVTKQGVSLRDTPCFVMHWISIFYKKRREIVSGIVATAEKMCIFVKGYLRITAHKTKAFSPTLSKIRTVLKPDGSMGVTETVPRLCCMENPRTSDPLNRSSLTLCAKICLTPCAKIILTPSKDLQQRY